jgi:hypothetical protein
MDPGRLVLCILFSYRRSRKALSSQPGLRSDRDLPLEVDFGVEVTRAFQAPFPSDTIEFPMHRNGRRSLPG